MTQKQDEGERREIPTGHTAMRQILMRFPTNHCSEPNDASGTYSFICEVDLPCYFWEPKNSARGCAGCFPAPPRIFRGNRQDQSVPLQTTSRSKGFDWAELLIMRYPVLVASLASTCFASAGTCSFKMWRNAPLRREPASPRRDQYSFTDTTNGLPGGGQARHKKARATGQIVSLVLGQCGILNLDTAILS